ncbi:Ger(x)C family spore germination protein [Bacillus sp. B1-b2]|uniref:Ger(x)C family spore germination protein n=1 Tax=Bacillus sp. B1-b2 TaxID=2653201 RepID=UPI0012629ADF|nr:Ger(x)C family spore germination protein [Bacillus sp. B1-b2]KAB7672500.1 Ger(x)C family spore germination protein [Bacillus sp. B1-b2]
MRKIGVVISILFLLLLTGCWDRKELSDIKIVSGMAIDKGKDAKFKVTVEALNAVELSTQTASGNAPTVVESIEGNSVSEITHQFNEYLAQLLVFSHMKVLVISEEIATKGMLDFIDYLERNREMRDDFNIIIAREGKAADILKVTTHFKKASSLKLSPQLNQLLQDWGGDPGVRINDFIDELALEGKEPVLATVKLKGDVKKGKSMENIMSVTPDALVVVDSLGIFKDEKLVGFLPLEDARNYLWIQNKLKQTSLSLTCKKDDYSSIRLTDSQTDIKAKWKDDKPYFDIKIKAEGYLEGTQCYKDIDEIGSIESYEKGINKTFSKAIEDTVKKVQKEYGTDIFGFGEMLRRQDYDAFMKVKDEWNQTFTEAEVNVNLDFIVRRSGIRSKSFLTDLEK